MDKKRIANNVSALLIIQITNQLLPLVTVPYLTRALGLEAYGTYAFTIAMITIACVITDFGFNLFATAEVASHRDNKDAINRLYGSVSAAKLLLLLLCLPVIWIYADNSGVASEHRVAIYWAALPIIGVTLQPIWLFNGLERMVYITLSVLISRLAFILLTFALVTSSDDLALLVGINGLSQIITGILSFIILIRLGYAPTRPSLSACCNVLKRASPFFVSRLAVSTYTAGGAFFLGIVAGTRSVALYAVAEQLYRGAQALLSPLGQVMYPYMVRTRNYRILIQTTLGTTVIAFFGSILAAYLGAYIIRLLFGDEFIEALPVLYIFLVIIIINTPSILLGYPMFGALGRLQLANRSVLIAGVMQIFALSCCYFLGKTTPVAVAWSVLLAELAVLSLRLIWGVKEWRLQRDNHNHMGKKT